ncbi:MAG: hypothetical protein M3N30_01085 [Bacteroidota bacterium]|nr:hypothetical protein [Bacteroidota bacterium]
MRKLLFFFRLTLLILLTQLTVSAQTSKPYTEGPVWTVQFIKTKPGMGLLYLRNLNDGWIKIMKESKMQGLILDYKVFSGLPGSKDDWDLMLMYEIKNHAAEDDLSDKMEAIRNKMFGSEEVQQKSAVARNDLRELLGSKTTQELIFK